MRWRFPIDLSEGDRERRARVVRAIDVFWSAMAVAQPRFESDMTAPLWARASSWLELRMSVDRSGTCAGCFSEPRQAARGLP